MLLRLLERTIMIIIMRWVTVLKLQKFNIKRPLHNMELSDDL